MTHTAEELSNVSTAEELSKAKANKEKKNTK
jgi:hypothetical protein